LDKDGNDLFLRSYQQKRSKQIATYLQAIASADTKPANRETAIRYLRNYPLHEYIAVFLKLLADPTESDDVRLMMAEALGWFEYSYRREEIVPAIEKCIRSGRLSAKLESEMKKTLKRLK
jgi:hypothetical protein